ncbi:hypothetical protein BC938DRAFT_471723 [Jimgerdemannia flammicorona]|uniref:Uncharacterized protein n=1 Tax=Jimgerdemannia flammicorona TaxID=994334 RepID=A0A433Q7J6_9FUNG|nr:hypothetical protein BC938DRAFT_471723 [Jimgerdemannia flammicorona]
MSTSDLLTAALASAANEQTSAIILKWCGPHWLFCSDAKSWVQRFTSEGWFVDSFDPSIELIAFFQTLHDLVSPDKVGAHCGHMHNFIDIEKFMPEHQHEWRRFCQKDLDCLSGSTMSSSTSISAGGGMCSILQRSEQVTIFNSHIYPLLKEDPIRVFGSANSFLMRFTLILVHEGLHWLLIVLCNMSSLLDNTPAKDELQRFSVSLHKIYQFLVYFDSMHESTQHRVINPVLKYLETMAAQRTCEVDDSQPGPSKSSMKDIRVVNAKV